MSWVQQVSNTTSLLRSVDFVDSLNGYAAGAGGAILKTTNGGITGYFKTSSDIPKSFHLYQNYPNPFNPTTKIKFSLPLPSKGGVQEVSLKIYDILGKQIASLIPPLWGEQEGLPPGTYEVEWNATNYPSGVYFYKLITKEYTETKKLILLK